jgi:hypothetical protein
MLLADIGRVFQSPFVIPVGVVAAIMLAWVLVSAVKQWRKARVAGYNARLKQLMIERGMSADEIKAVLEAGGDSEDPSEDPDEE